uniref:Uncharacterized protein n=1 Tax=Anguilla anguilla TaxID=7936 RepID=A0A0E9U627_ANGAN
MWSFYIIFSIFLLRRLSSKEICHPSLLILRL